jgi:hypothetical protein
MDDPSASVDFQQHVGVGDGAFGKEGNCPLTVGMQDCRSLACIGVGCHPANGLQCRVLVGEKLASL